MPLVKAALESGIKSILETEFKSNTLKTALRIQMDGGGLGGASTSAKNINQGLTNIKNKSAALSAVAGAATVNAFAPAIQQISANEWANGLSDSICEWLSAEVAPIIADAVASEVDLFVKSGLVTTTVATTGTAAAQAGAGTGAIT